MHVWQIVIMSLFIFMCSSKDNFREKKERKQTNKPTNKESL